MDTCGLKKIFEFRKKEKYVVLLYEGVYPYITMP